MLGGALLLLAALAVVITSGGGPPAPTGHVAPTTAATSATGASTSATSASTASSAAGTVHATKATDGAPSLEAGVEPWQLAAPISREVLLAVGDRLRIVGGLSPAGSSLGTASWLDPRSGTVTAAGSLADVVHDGAGAQLGATSFVFGGGSPTTFATVQSLGPSAGTGRVAGQLPQPRSDLAAATVGRTVYLVGGYDGTTYEPSVLATDGRHPLQHRGHAQGARALPGGRRAGHTPSSRSAARPGAVPAAPSPPRPPFRRSTPPPTPAGSSAPFPKRCTARPRS